MKKIKILHLTHTDINFDNRILKEITALSEENNYEIFALGVLDPLGSRTKLEIDAKVKMIKLYSKKLTFFPRFVRHGLNILELFFPMILKGILYRPSVIHCHDTLVLPIGSLIKIFTGAKLIYDAHELESNKNGQTAFLSKATLLIERICWPLVNVLISVSPSILDWYEKKLGYKKNELILNSPFIKKFKDEISNYKKNYFNDLYSIPDNRLIFIYLGMLEKGRGIEYAVKAFSSSKIKSHIVFIGHGSLELEIILASKKFNNIHLHNPVPHEEVVSLVKNADVGLCIVENISLSDYFCLPNKLFEYSFSGIPVLASNFPDIANYVSLFNLGTCTEINEESIISSIQDIELNDGIKNKNFNNLFKLSWKQQAKKLKNIYDEILH
tara:strand:+ start:10573 stop:11724 length:1152 start_codon:yes stop_codon:yes gene_type:complete